MPIDEQLGVFSSVIRLASLRKLSGGERAAVAVAPFARIILSSCLAPSAIDTVALCPKDNQRPLEAAWSSSVGPGKKSEPLESSHGTVPFGPVYTL